MNIDPKKGAIGLLVLAVAVATAAARFSDTRSQGDAAADPSVLCADPARLPGPRRLLCGVGLDVNRDPAVDLELLPGIGPVKARRIVESREREGPFRSVEDLDRVPGVGTSTVERLRPWLVFEGPPRI
ncbi:MAG: ComEA family DNA-binding protein [Deltaproteobacteria bacterium]|nr:ComEA family DNA-binding protein [Deltaproteobacteria bacterium]